MEKFTVKELRKNKLRWSCEEVAQYLGITKESYMNKEAGRRKFTSDEFLNLCSLMKVTPYKVEVPKKQLFLCLDGLDYLNERSRYKDFRRGCRYSDNCIFNMDVRYKPMFFNDMILSETLFPHLWEVQQTCEKRMELLMEELLAKNPTPDKATQQLAWVAHMNSLKSQAEDIVLRELVYEEDIVRKSLNNFGMVMQSRWNMVRFSMRSIENYFN